MPGAAPFPGAAPIEVAGIHGEVAGIPVYGTIRTSEVAGICR